MLNTVEVIWIQVNLPHLKPILVGSCYRPPCANSQYLYNMCEMLDNVCGINRELYFLGELNIDCLSSSWPFRKKLQTVTSAFNLVQSTYQGIYKQQTGMKSSTCISKSIGCSDHNIVAICRKAGHNMVYKRSYNKFCSDSCVDDVKNICQPVVCNEEQPEAALDAFKKLLIPVTNKHALIKKNCKNG